ncbi:MAG: hypothetical protein EOO43_08390 [Flavobacterium sp.]|nr:MAG: hypothetical protein EOO43_08390 [Flavobacterium sp.]
MTIEQLITAPLEDIADMVRVITGNYVEVDTFKFEVSGNPQTCYFSSYGVLLLEIEIDKLSDAYKAAKKY